MSWRQRIGIAVAGAVIVPVAAASGATVSAAEGTDPPNVVVIMTDDQTFEQMRVMPQTKALVGDAGVTYSNFVINLPLCCPSRSTFLTGQYAHNHGVLSNDSANGGYAHFESSTALPVWLQKSGYRTIHIGKFLNGYGKPNKTEVPVGWNDWQAMIPPNYYNYDINDNGTVVHYGTTEADYSTDVLATRAEEAIAESAPGGPFFLNLAVYGPHDAKSVGTTLRSPIPAPRDKGTYSAEALPLAKSYNEANVSDKPAYVQALPRLKARNTTDITTRYRDGLESLQSVDDAVVRVMNALTAAGELENTVVMFVSDNGFMHGQHRITSSKGTPYEEAIHVPFMVRGPGFTAGTTVNTLVSNIDVAPTIAAIAGATPLLTVDGVDFRTAPTDRAVMIETYDGNCFTGLRTATESYVRYYTGEEEYYDLVADPQQLASRHLSLSASSRLAVLRAQLDLLQPDLLPVCMMRSGGEG